jgi:CBS domain-containing protein
MKTIRAIVGGQKTLTVDSRTSVRDVVRQMAERQIGGVPVVDGDRVVGIFTERDVLTRIVAAGRVPDETLVGDVMSTNLVLATLDESYEACLSRMQSSHVRHLIVIDEQQRLAGVVSLRDLLAVDIDEKAEAISLLNAYVHFGK